jgi:hypothetical protein
VSRGGRVYPGLTCHCEERQRRSNLLGIATLCIRSARNDREPAGFIPASCPLNPKHQIRNAKQYRSTNDQNLSSNEVKDSKQNEFCYLDLEF